MTQDNNNVNDPQHQDLHLSRRKVLTALGTMACGGLLLGGFAQSAAAKGLSVLDHAYGEDKAASAGPVSVASLTASGVDDGWANVLDYGAVGDGVTDDTAAF